MNKALRFKWNWHFAMEDGAYWRNIIAKKYGVKEGDWTMKKVIGSYGFSVWKSMCAEGIPNIQN